MIEIIKCKIINKKTLIATVDIKLPKMQNFIIHDVTIWEKNNHSWAKMPSREYEIEGVKKYHAHCRFEDKDVNEKFQTAIVEAFLSHCKKNNISLKAQEEEIPF